MGLKADWIYKTSQKSSSCSRILFNEFKEGNKKWTLTKSDLKETWSSTSTTIWTEIPQMMKPPSHQLAHAASRVLSLCKIKPCQWRTNLFSQLNAQVMRRKPIYTKAFIKSKTKWPKQRQQKKYWLFRKTLILWVKRRKGWFRGLRAHPC